MSAVNQISGDRSDVPDLLKSLADYPFSFPAFEDTGKNDFLCLKKGPEVVNVLYLFTYCAAINQWWGQ